MAKHFSESMAEIVSRTADDMYALGKADAADDFAATLATQAAQIEAIKKVRDQYASQARFADIDCAVHFRDFVRRIDAALAAVGEKKP